MYILFYSIFTQEEFMIESFNKKKKQREKSFVEDHRDSVLDYKLIAETLREMSFVVISSQTIANTNIEK